MEKRELATNLELIVQDNGIAEIVFGPEGGMPATDKQGHAALGSIWRELSADSRVRCILVHSRGKGFCAGGTPDVVQGMLDSETERLRVMREARDIVQGMVDCDKPIVSAINGAAVGAGAAIALLADISIAGEKAKIIDGHTKLGVAAGDHAALIWPLLCGIAKAKYHLLLCNAIDGTEAERIGLVSRVAPDDQLMKEAQAIAERLAQGSPAALAYTKRSLNHWLRSAWPAFEHSLALEILGFAGAEAKEGFTAIQKKRPAAFGKA